MASFSSLIFHNPVKEDAAQRLHKTTACIRGLCYMKSRKRNESVDFTFIKSDSAQIRSLQGLIPFQVYAQKKENKAMYMNQKRSFMTYQPLWIRPIAPYTSKETLNISLMPSRHSLFKSLWFLEEFQQPKQKRATFTTSASYNENSRDGALKLGGFCFSPADLQIASGAASTVMFAVANKLLHKIALVPLKEFPYLLALVSTFGYVLVYFSILYTRYQMGIITDEMLELPKSYFALSGALEALGLVSNMAAVAVLPGTSVSILLQTFLVWQLILSMIFLKKRYSIGQIVGCVMVLAGVAFALVGNVNRLGSSIDGSGLFWPLIMVLSCAFQASSTIVKEFVFQETTKHLKGCSVDIFVVNSFGSAFQAIFVLLLLPFLSRLNGIQFRKYMTDGAGCLFNVGSMSTVCSGATILALSYIVVNLAFNISLLSLLKMSSAVVSSLCSSLAVPITIYLFTLPLPYIGATTSLHPQFIIGTSILLCGLCCYNYFGSVSKCGCNSNQKSHSD